MPDKNGTESDLLLGDGGTEKAEADEQPQA